MRPARPATLGVSSATVCSTMMHFKTCCCRYSLKAGSVAVAVVSAVASLAALATALALAYGESCCTEAEAQDWARRAADAGLAPEEVQRALREVFSTRSFITQSTRVLLNLLGVVEAFHFNFCLILLYGIWKERSGCVRLWVRAGVCAAALRLLLLLPVVAQMLAGAFVQLGAAALVLVMLSLPLSVYFILIVNSYHSKMISEKLIKSYSEWANMS